MVLGGLLESCAVTIDEDNSTPQEVTSGSTRNRFSKLPLSKLKVASPNYLGV